MEACTTLTVLRQKRTKNIVLHTKNMCFQAWDADEGLNGRIHYFLNFLSSPDVAAEIFGMNLETGDVQLKLPLTDLAGQTFQVNYFNSQFL